MTKFVNREVLNNSVLVDYLKVDLHPKFMIEGYFKNPKVFNYRYQEIDEMFVLVLNFYDEEFIGWIFYQKVSLLKIISTTANC